MTSSETQGRRTAKVRAIPINNYAAFRLRDENGFSFNEDSQPPPERLLQAVWQHQRLRRDQLATTDGEPLRILHPGFLSREGGPDFRGAVIQRGADAPLSGDIEVDLQANGWKAHRHDRNPAFQNVILHVIWNGDRANGSPPTLTLEGRLDAPIQELALWTDTEPAQLLPEACRGKCCAPFQSISVEQQKQLLREAGEVRFRSKASHLQARARQAGWEQALWEGLFRALGYKHNSWPMQSVAELRSRWAESDGGVAALQARVLGISGLLPAELTRARTSADDYLRSAWHRWWREREQFHDCILPRTVWRFHGQRPANHPQRRLALAAHWISEGSVPERLQHWCTEQIPQRRLPDSLLKILNVPADEFWSWHWTLRSPRMPEPQPLLGAARVTDIAVNAVLPWLWIRAVEGKNQMLQRAMEDRFKCWPAAEDNSVLKLARQRLLGTDRRRVLENAVEQQGLIQITRDFCDRSNAACEQCRFPELVEVQFGTGARSAAL